MPLLLLKLEKVPVLDTHHYFGLPFLVLLKLVTAVVVGVPVPRNILISFRAGDQALFQLS